MSPRRPPVTAVSPQTRGLLTVGTHVTCRNADKAMPFIITSISAGNSNGRLGIQAPEDGSGGPFPQFLLRYT